MPPLDPYVLKANGVAFSGLQVQLAEGELTAAKSSYIFNMDAEGFTLDNGATNMSWDHVKIAAGHATDFQAIIPAVAGNPQATTLQINDKIAFNMSGSYAYMNKDEVHIFDNNASHTATYGTSLVLENVSDNLVLDIGTDGISFTPGYTKISWPDILSAGLPFADSWLFAVNDNASYNTSTLVLNNTLNINDGTTDNVINITTVSEPSINLANVGTSTSALSSILNNANLTITDFNTDGVYNNGTSILDSVSLSLGHTPAVGSSNDIAINTVDATVNIQTDNNGEISLVNIAADGLTNSFTSADTFTLSTGIFNKTTLSRLSIYNDGTDPLTALNDSFEITSVNSNMTFNLIESNPISNDSSALHSYQQVSKNSDGVYKSTLDLTAFNSSTNDTNSITLSAIDTANSITIPTIELNITGTSTSKPSGYFSTGELNLTDLNAAGSYNNSKTTVLSNNLSITRSTDGVNSKAIAMNNTSGYATSFSIIEIDTNSDSKIVTVDTGLINMGHVLTSLHQTNYANMSPSVINSMFVFDDSTTNSVSKSLSYTNNTSTNSFTLQESNPFTEDQSTFTSTQRVSVGNDGGYNSAATVQYYNASTNTTKSISLTAVDSNNSIVDPVIKVNDGTIVSSLKSQSLSSTGNLSLSVPTGKELTLAVPSGADLVIGNGAVSNVADGGLTNLWMRIKVGSTYYKIPLMADMSILDNSTVINADILDRLSQNVNSLTVNDTYTLLLGKSVISYTGDREYWGPPQDTVSTYVSMNNTSYLKLTNFDYVGWDFNSINFTSSGTLSGKIFISLWTDISMTIRFSVVNTTITSGGVSTEYKTTINSNNGSWTYVEVNLADFVFDKGDGTAVKATVFSDIRQFLFATDLNISNPVYIQYVALKRTA